MAVLEQFGYLEIKLEAIKLATNNFAEEHVIGEGGFGRVYKGELVHSKGHTTVALKRLDRNLGQGDSEFWKEVILLSVYKHQNIVSLLGFCDEKDEKILVYEYAFNQSLDLHLANEDLTWVRRLTICIGAARGLAYLHDPAGTQQRVLHRDIKSSNILLDENWNARIADVGLSKFGPANQLFTFVVSNNIAGTLGYCDPLYLASGILTKESDVYSFGVVLFEVLCGRLCYGSNDDKPQSFIQLVRKHYKENKLTEIIWGRINNEIHPNSLDVFSTIAYQCLKNNNGKRPIMNEIVTQLEIALQCQLSGASVSKRTQQDKAQPSFQPAFQKLKEKFNISKQVRRLKTREVDGKSLVLKVPKDLRRHICFDFVKKVPLFMHMNERFIDDICERMKPHLFKRKTYIIRQGDPVYALLFIVHGHIEVANTDGRRNVYLEAGDFSGHELLSWALENKLDANLPSSTVNLKVLKEVKAFALPANELKSVINQYSRGHNKRVKHIFRYYSPQWRTWAACFIQVAWKLHSNRKIWELHRMEGNSVGGAVSFPTNALHGVHLNLYEHLYGNLFDREMLKSQKPQETFVTSDSD